MDDDVITTCGWGSARAVAGFDAAFLRQGVLGASQKKRAHGWNSGMHAKTWKRNGENVSGSAMRQGVAIVKIATGATLVRLRKQRCNAFVRRWNL